MIQGLRRWLLDDFLSRKIAINILTLKTKKEEAIMRKSIMKTTILGCIGVFLISALILVPAAQAGEKTEKFKGRHVTQIVKAHVFKVGDVEGHIIGILQRRGLDFKNGEVAFYRNWITFDTTKGKGTAAGYSQVTYEDGSTTVAKVQATLEPLEGRRSTGKGTFTYVRGSGRFEGIEGGGSWTFKSFTPYTKEETKSDAIVDYTGTRTLPSKK
jgi:hypothetical protein